MTLDPVILFFALGVLARLAKSDLRLPEALYETLSIYLLVAIGLKGGAQLAVQPLATLWPVALAAIAISAAVPLVLFPVLRTFVRLGTADAASIAAHYGSVSVVTFAVAQSALTRAGIEPDAYLAMLVALMEAPGIVVGVLLARRGLAREGSGVRPGGAAPEGWGALLHEVLLGKAIVLLLGGITIGWASGPTGLAPLDPLFVGLFKGVLALFLLELGLVAGGRVQDLRRAGPRLLAFGLVAPPLLAIAGGAIGVLLGLSVAGVATLATLTASASYIAAPTAMWIAVPQANPSLSIGVALGVTFPFNVLVGIPIYVAAARALGGG
ncbi:MAG: sodium-dependent bicarbonate transport family permease [Burkholderiales bacterium]